MKLLVAQYVGLFVLCLGAYLTPFRIGQRLPLWLRWTAATIAIAVGVAILKALPEG